MQQLGNAFVVARPGRVTKIRFYKFLGESTPATRTGRIYDQAGGELTSQTFTGEGSSGWQATTLTFPVSVVPGKVYVVSYNTGDYATWYINALNVYVFGNNNVWPVQAYYNDTVDVFPNQAVGGGHVYMLDVEFEPGPGLYLGN